MNETNDSNGGPSTGADAGQGGPFVPKSARDALRPEKAPPPPRRSRRARSQLVIFGNFVFSTLVLLAILALGAVYFGKVEFERPGPLAHNTTFLVKKGAGVSEIANDLERQNIISDARLFRIASIAHMRHGTLKAGEYGIEAHASMKEVMDLLRSGKSILYSLTLPEGLTVQEIFDRMRADPVLTGDLPDKLPEEGTLWPDTYKFTRGTSRQEILAEMEAADKRIVDEIWSHRDPDLPIKNKQDFVTLASIVEKETGKADERPMVASVFLNRLEKGMRLQSDPTVIYGVYGGKGKPSGTPLYQSDLDKDTPYNTYLHKGLPPTPIANPGRAALEAVANPSKTDDLYFVADGTGAHVFAASLKEHNANVRRWREIQADRAKEADKNQVAKPAEAAQ
ncbi:MAG: endolytic transglycosylase MltG [Pararhizobium sp.]